MNLFTPGRPFPLHLTPAMDGEGGGGANGPTAPKKKYRPGRIELDPADCALVVHYEAELLEEGPGGERHVLERTPGVKKIKASSKRNWARGWA